MKKLLNLLLLFASIVVVGSCSNDDELVTPQAENEEKNTTKITVEEAQQDLLGLLAELDRDRSRSYGKLPRTIKNSYSIRLGLNESRSDGDDPELYVFNFNDNQGYAIMSGDERIPSLIALSDSGSYDLNMAGGTADGNRVAILEDSLKKYVITPYEGGIGFIDWGDTVYKKYGDWTNNVYKNSAYCTVKWNQGYPYNKYCVNNSGNPVPTGCVATAVAQLMSVYKYPSSYGSFSFNWDEMTNEPYASWCSSVGQDNIARLMRLLGSPENLSIEYNKNSGANFKNIIRTLKAFNYTNGGTLYDYGKGGEISELQNGYPVLADGVTKRYDNEAGKEVLEGHAWLMHGLLVRSRIVEIHDMETKVLLRTYLECTYYPLCNWGWGGDQDGYYLDGTFAPGAIGPVFAEDLGSPEHDPNAEHLNFQYRQRSITGIRK